MPIGKTSSTRIQTNTSDEFSFWLDTKQGVKVNPTDIVIVQNSDGSKTYGLVTRIENMSDSESHLDNLVSHDFGDASSTSPRMQRLSANVARCIVLKNTQDIYMPVANGCNVEFADTDGILKALGIGDVKEVDPKFRPLPAGVIELSNGIQAPAIIDARYLLGPEGAHLNITGISGLATKTSYVMFLLNILLQKYDDEIAVIIFNVKHDDLLYIDQPGDSLNEEQQKLWEVLGIQPKPFQNVTYFIPRGVIGRQRQAVPNTFASPLPANCCQYSYALSDIRDKISYLFVDVEDPRDTLRPLIEDIEEDLQSGRIQVQTFTELIEHFRQILSPPPTTTGQKPQRRSYHDHKHLTIGKFVRLFRYFVQTGTSGVFVDNKASNEVTLAHYVWAIRPGQVYVIDIAKLHDYERGFVVGDVINEVYRLFAREITYRDVPQEIREKVWPEIDSADIDKLDEPIEPPKKLVFFVDELNKYAPSGRDASPILRNLLEITERGRSLGIILIGAEQFASSVHPRIIGNCSNKVYGRSDSTELSNDAYRHIPQDLKALITRLEQGKLLLQHPLYRQPVQIKFPRPVYKQPRR